MFGQSNNLISWIIQEKEQIFRKIIYPGFKINYHGICDWFLFSLFVLPSYFGIRLVFFDLTAIRLFEILLLLCIWKNRVRRGYFFSLVRKCPSTVYIGVFYFVVFCTNLLRFSINSILNWLTDFVFVFFLVLYLIIYEYGISKFLNKIRRYVWIMTCISPLELIIGRPPFSLLDTLGKSNIAFRFGSVRIMGNCTTNNGYAMMLVILLPIICYDTLKNKVDILKNKWIIMLTLFNVFLTGSRLTVGTSLLALGLCIIIQKKNNFLKFFFVICITIPILIFCTYVFREVSFIKSLLCTFFSAFDEIFNTNYAVNYGANAEALANSSYYRELLFKYAVLEGWFNPLLGRGGAYRFSLYVENYLIQSVDNFYVGQYIAYAWPGVIAWLLMTIKFILISIKGWLKSKEACCYVFLVSVVVYYLNLWYLDQLQTYPIIVAVFAMICSVEVLHRNSSTKTSHTEKYVEP